MDSFMLNAALYVRDPRHDHNQAAAATSTIAAAASSTTTTSSSASATTHHGHHSGVNYTCPVPNEQGPPIVPLSIGMTFHHLAVIIAGALMGVACILSLGLIIAHATHFSVPAEQKQIIRITFTITVFAVISFLSILFESKAVYLNPLLDLYESWALCGFFLLLSAYVAPHEQERERVLQDNGKLGLYNRAWFFCFQQPFVLTILFIVQEITQAAGIFCQTSKEPQFAHPWVSSITTISQVVAIMAVLRYHKGIKSLTAQKKPLLKLISFKSIVFLETTQAALFSWLTSSGHIHANNHLTFNDFTVGIQSLIVCGEMVFFSILFQFAYPIGPYLKSHQATSHGNIHHVGGFLGIKAFVAALNITDLLKGLIVAPAKLFRGRAMGKSESSSNIA